MASDAPSTQGARRARRSRRGLVVAAASLLGALLVAELLVRAAVGSPVPERTPLLRVRAHPTRGWEMVPGEAHYTYGHRVRVNELGLRGPEVGAKADGELRVLVLGDSLVYGQGCADEDTVPARLERALRERRPERGWTVVNGGLRAYGTRQELALLEELGPRLDPDVVLLAWYENDLPWNDVDAVRQRLEASGPVTFDLGEAMDGWPAARWHLTQLLRRSALLMWAYDALREDEGARMARVDQGVAFRRLEKALARFERLAGELESLPLFCVLPVAASLRDADAPRAIDRRALEIARASGLAALDLWPALREVFVAEGRLPVIPFDGHYDPLGNAAIAERLAAWLVERLDATRGDH